MFIFYHITIYRFFNLYIEYIFPMTFFLYNFLYVPIYFLAHDFTIKISVNIKIKHIPLTENIQNNLFSLDNTYIYNYLQF